MEEFKKIKDYINYSISNLGNVRNDKTGRILKYFQKPNGYRQVQLGRENNPVYIHRLVAMAFVKNKDNKPQVNHIDGDKTNNSANNLEWVTASENTYAYGYKERNEHKQKRIKATNLNGKELIFNSRYETAKYFKCHKSQISYGRYYVKGIKKGWKFELMI